MRLFVTAAALVLLALPAAASAAEPIDGTWEGAYVCGQGKTGLTLTLDGTADGQVTGTFSFWPRQDNPDVPSGSFAVRGTITPQGDLRLQGDHWIDQPAGFEMVGLEGKALGGLNGGADAMMGTVIPQGVCTEWAAKRR
ncbi:MAG: hypothetical protein JWR84_3437 [Caulobacter sp.]|nr:hypothetical protein [Caulobacter sp.]